MRKSRSCLGISGTTSWGEGVRFWCRNDLGADIPNTARSSSPSLGCGRWVKACSCTDGGKTERSFPWKSVSVRSRRKRARLSPVPSATSPNESWRRKHCGGARVIWQKRRGSRIRGVGPGGYQKETPCISPRNGIAYTALIQNRACRLGKTGYRGCIRRIEPKWERQKIGQSVKSRITKWNTEFFFRTAPSNTLTPSAILF